MHKSSSATRSSSNSPATGSSPSSPRMLNVRTSSPFRGEHIYSLSPASSSTESSQVSAPDWSGAARYATPSIEAFLLNRSRVVRFFGLPEPPEQYLASVLYSPHSKFPRPLSMWTLRDVERRNNTIWAVFQTHDEACTALSLTGLASHLSLAPALDHELEPFHKLRPVQLVHEKTQMMHLSPLNIHNSPYSSDNASRHDFALSSNPPNPRTSFRLGDWICSSSNCAAHNFGRNVACIGCGCPRSGSALSSPTFQVTPPTARPLPSPRFASSPNSQTSFSPASTYPSPSPVYPPLSKVGSSKPAHPLLTPSGRTFAVGGRVQNISTDPLNPCVMYWPDNEALPDQGQIRPSGLVGISPPILNTGNRGPISHQPGDWVCGKCSYLNWRRRKVCQTCLPYAEGNGDSISAAVQAERIALLTNVLAKTHIQGPQRSHSMTPPQVHRPFINRSPPHPRAQMYRSQSHLELGGTYTAMSPIYQTSGHLHAPAPAPLLPSFLQDLVQSPMLSPASTSSADLSFDEYDHTIHDHAAAKAPNAPLASIWKMDGEEYSAINRSRQTSRESLNVL